MPGSFVCLCHMSFGLGGSSKQIQPRMDKPEDLVAVPIPRLLNHPKYEDELMPAGFMQTLDFRNYHSFNDGTHLYNHKR